MSITERDRRDIHNGLEDSLGTDVANNLMQLLPHEPAGRQLVTRTDMQANTIRLRGEIAELRGQMDRLHGTMQRMFAGALVANGIAVATALLT